MARIRKDTAALKMGKFLKKHSDLDPNLFGVIVREDKALVGFYGLTEEEISAKGIPEGFVVMTSDEVEARKAGSTTEPTERKDKPVAKKAAKKVKTAAPKKAAKKAKKTAAKKAPRAKAEGERDTSLAYSAKLKATAVKEGKPLFRKGSTREKLLSMLQRSNGVTIDQAAEAIGWDRKVMNAALHRVATLASLTLTLEKREGKPSIFRCD